MGRGLRAPGETRGLAAVCRGNFPTPSGKAELYSSALEAQGLDPLPSPGDIATGQGLQLITGKTLHFLNSGYRHMERHRRRTGDLFIELHPVDAERRRVHDGDAVRVSGHGGDVRAIAASRIACGRAWRGCHLAAYDAAGARQSVNLLTAEEPTDWGGGSGLYDAFVEVAADT